MQCSWNSLSKTAAWIPCIGLTETFPFLREMYSSLSWLFHCPSHHMSRLGNQCLVYHLPFPCLFLVLILLWRPNYSFHFAIYFLTRILFVLGIYSAIFQGIQEYLFIQSPFFSKFATDKIQTVRGLFINSICGLIECAHIISSLSYLQRWQ